MTLVFIINGNPLGGMENEVGDGWAGVDYRMGLEMVTWTWWLREGMRVFEVRRHVECPWIEVCRVSSRFFLIFSLFDLDF